MLRQTFSSNIDIIEDETSVETLGECRFKNPTNNVIETFELLGKRIIINPFIDEGSSDLTSKISFEIAAPQEKIYFKPAKVKAGIITCGGICPGLNNVIRAVALSLYHNYGCTKILGFKYGLQGLIEKYKHPIVELTPEMVTNIHNTGGSLLGTSRGPQPIDQVVDTLERLGINQLYFIGGDGSLRAAEAIAKEVKKRKLNIGVVGIPKTIDNDIPLSSESFGFDTAVDIATSAIRSAHVEATSNPYGIGLVKLMGRHSGFIAALASLSQRDVNFVLIPEHDFDLEGPKGLLSALKERMITRKHAVIVVAEGAGQKFFKKSFSKKDPSGNVGFKDIGYFLKDRINQYFAQQQIPINLKYIDPSYMIRSVQSNTHDNLFAATLGQNSVHALMAGKTNMMISLWHGVYCYVPLALVNARVKRLSMTGRVWTSTLETTGQPALKND